jgi:hypothetical protein
VGSSTYDPEYQSRYYQANKAKRIAEAAEGAKRHRAKRIEIVHKAKSVPCADCGESYPYYVMQFDHVVGEKKFNIGAAGWGYVKMQDLIDEIAKCEVVCANCHAKRTHARRTTPS